MSDKPEGITLEMQGGKDGVPVKRLIVQMKALLSSLVELDISMSDDQRKTTRWVIAQVSYNSPLTLRVEPRPIRGRTPNPEVTKAYVRGIKILERTSSEPPHFTESVMQSTRRLLKTSGKVGGEVTITDASGERVKSSQKTVKHINRILEIKQSKEYTTVEGILGSINVFRSLQFRVFDTMTEQPTTCQFSPALYQTAYESLGKRVAVSGMASFDRLDHPSSMIVDEINGFEDPEGLPRFLEGEEVDITGGIESAEYVRRGRDVE